MKAKNILLFLLVCIANIAVLSACKNKTKKNLDPREKPDRTKYESYGKVTGNTPSVGYEVRGY